MAPGVCAAMTHSLMTCLRRPQLYALSRVSVADSNKPLLVAEGDTRVLDTCATVLSWGTPGGPVDGGGGRWSPLMVRRGQEHCSEALFQLSLSAVGKRAMRAHDGCMRVLRHHARAAAEDVEVGGRCRGALAAPGPSRKNRIQRPGQVNLSLSPLLLPPTISSAYTHSPLFRHHV